jgi:hypothetical protein
MDRNRRLVSVSGTGVSHVAELRVKPYVRNPDPRADEVAAELAAIRLEARRRASRRLRDRQADAVGDG